MNYFFSLSGLLIATTLHATPWQYEVAPYVWASGLKGTIQIGHKKIHVSETFTDLLKELDVGAMLWAGAYKDNFGVFFNGFYTKVSDNQRIKEIPIASTSQLTIASVGASYRLFISADNTHYLEPFIGARYTDTNTTVMIGPFHAQQNIRWTDAIIGSRANYNITPHFNLEGSADYGQGNRSTSYNLSLIAGYQSPNYFKNTRFYAGYRILHENYRQGVDANFYQWRMNLLGPVAGFLIKF